MRSEKRKKGGGQIQIEGPLQNNQECQDLLKDKELFLTRGDKGDMMTVGRTPHGQHHFETYPSS